MASIARCDHGRTWTRQRAQDHETSVLLLAARRHFLHEGSAVSTCSRRTKSPHSVQAAPSGASLVGSVMWVFGFAIEIGRLPPPKHHRLVALHSWGFLRAIGPAVATRPPARSLGTVKLTDSLSNQRLVHSLSC